MRAYVYTRVYLQERMCKSACARAHVPSRLDRHVRMCASVGSQGCDARSRRGGSRPGFVFCILLARTRCKVTGPPRQACRVGSGEATGWWV